MLGTLFEQILCCHRSSNNTDTIKNQGGVAHSLGKPSLNQNCFMYILISLCNQLLYHTIVILIFATYCTSLLFHPQTDYGTGVAETCLFSNLKVLFSSLRLLQNCCFYVLLETSCVNLIARWHFLVLRIFRAVPKALVVLI